MQSIRGSPSLTLALVAVAHLAGCASAVAARRQELVEVAKLGLAEVEGIRGELIIVAGPHVTEEAVAALRQLRTIILPSQVPKSARYALPEGYFVLQQLSLRGAGASLVGTVGPRFHTDRCGSTTDVSMRHGSDGVWRVASTTVTQC